MQFTKSHALGNDYIIIEEEHLTVPLSEKNIQKICDRHWGASSDGILLLTKPGKADYGFRIFNPDGSEAEISGNGLRIFIKYLFDHKSAPRQFTIQTKKGIVNAEIAEEKDGVATLITVDIGAATFLSSEIPVAGEKREVVKETLNVADRTYTITAVSVGNPHCVIFTDTLDVNELRKYGPLIENHESFPNRINVQFAKVIDRSTISILIWERGAGETSASGSSSCAVASAAKKNGLAGNNVTIQSPGGELHIKLDDQYNLTMTGPASEVYAAQFSQEFIQLLDKV